MFSHSVGNAEFVNYQRWIVIYIYTRIYYWSANLIYQRVRRQNVCLVLLPLHDNNRMAFTFITSECGDLGYGPLDKMQRPKATYSEGGSLADDRRTNNIICGVQGDPHQSHRGPAISWENSNFFPIVLHNRSSNGFIRGSRGKTAGFCYAGSSEQKRSKWLIWIVIKTK